MKKILSIALSLLLVLLVVPMAIYAEGNTITVGSTGDYATIAEAVTAAADGDTIQLVDNITETNVTISKAVTIDTNGFVWTGGTGSKINCGNIKASVTFTNSQRTSQITADATPDIVANSVKNQGVFVVGSSQVTVTCENIAIKSTNAYENNQGCAFYASDKTFSMVVKNSFFTSDKFASLVMYKCALTLTAEDSIFDGKCATYVTDRLDKGSNLYFKNCTLNKMIGYSSANNNYTADNGTNPITTRAITLEGCTVAGVYGPGSTTTFVGTNAVDTVYTDVVVAAGEGTTLYADSAYTTEVASGVVTADTAIYSLGEGTVPEESSSEVVEPEEPSSEPEVHS
ncbi:MAG: hypothetical protein IJD90_01235, partial [Clostridia bacterium]|nr:hypothetical protein [Clostridia bacterium]